MNSIDQKMDDYREKRRKHPASNAQLLAQAVASFAGRDEDGASENPYWEAVRVLHCRADQDLMEACRLFVRDSDPAHRCIAANILAQVHFGDASKRTEAADLVMGALETEGSPEAVEDMIYALGHMGDVGALPLVLRFAAHTCADVRYAVAYSLPMHSEDSARVVAALIELTRDVDDDVRDWATFGLGSQLDLDTAEIREALFARLADADGDARGEAMVGLARRLDKRVLPVLVEAVSGPASATWDRYCLEADACRVAVERLVKTQNAAWRPLLMALRGKEFVDGEVVGTAIARAG